MEGVGVREGAGGYQSLGAKVLAGPEVQWKLSNGRWNHEVVPRAAEGAAQSSQRGKTLASAFLLSPSHCCLALARTRWETEFEEPRSIISSVRSPQIQSGARKRQNMDLGETSKSPTYNIHC